MGAAAVALRTFVSGAAGCVVVLALLVATATSTVIDANLSPGVLGPDVYSWPTTTHKTTDHDEYPKVIHLEVPALG